MLSKLARKILSSAQRDWEPYCWAPWTHAHLSISGNRALCCLSAELPSQNRTSVESYWNSPLMRKMRRMMRRKQLPSECVKCQDSANPAYLSFGNLSEEAKRALREKTSILGRLDTAPTSFDYRFSNKCNFKCRMCGPSASSSHEKEALELGGPYSLYKWQRDPEKSRTSAFMKETERELLAAIENGSVHSIYWAGGEPLLLDFHWQAMARVLELGLAEKVHVSYNTNLSLLKYRGTHLYQDVLRHFPNFQIGASLDATGEIGEYIRSGMSWPVWEANFSELVSSPRSGNQQVSIALCLTTLSLLDLGNLVRLAEKHKVKLAAQSMQGGFDAASIDPLSPLALPRPLLNRLIDEALTEIGPMRSSLNETLFRELEHLRTTPLWCDLYPDTYARGLRAEIRKIKAIEAHRDPEKAKPGFRDFLSRQEAFQDWLEEYW